MPRTRSLAWSQLKIGILAVAASVLAIMLIFAVGGDAGLFSGKRYLKTRFANAAGVQSGAVVRLAGVNIGSVEDVYFDGAVVEMVLRVRPDAMPRITSDSVAVIGSVSLLGEGAIDITAATTGTPLKDWDYVRSDRTPGQIAEVAENASQTLAQAAAMIEDMRAGKGTAGKLITDDALYRQITDVVAATNQVMSAIAQGRGPAGTLINNKQAAQNLERALANLDTATSAIANGQGTIGTLLKDDALAKSLTATVENLRTVTGSLKAGEGTAGKLFTDAALYNRLDALTTRLDGVAEGLARGEGTAGRLLRDQELYDNINGAATELRGLLQDIRKDPKKYLNVKVSIF